MPVDLVASPGSLTPVTLVFLELKSVLNPDETARLNALARDLKFVDGRLSNPANETKNNLQADLNDPRYGESSQLVLNALMRSREFRDFAMPMRVAPPLMARYEPGMCYGVHADSAHMRLPNGILRSDLSCTVFIADPVTYEGGELTTHLGTRVVTFKGAAGDAIVYPSTTLHEVRPVTKGTRLVSITFIESVIADEAKRYAVYELGEVSALEGLNMRFENRMRLDAVRANLIRLWSARG
jgi:PKHD-type hydroxylase